MRSAILTLVVLVGLSTSAAAHHPLWPAPPIWYRFEPIPPLGNHLPWSHRQRLNRPTYLGGKIAFLIEPSSQEAMSWHENVHRGAYRRHAGRIEPMYFYPKPWEVLTAGPRTPRATYEGGELVPAPQIDSQASGQMP